MGKKVKKVKQRSTRRRKLAAEFFPGLAELVDDVNEHERRLTNLEHHEGVDRKAIIHARELLAQGDYTGADCVLEKALNSF